MSIIVPDSFLYFDRVKLDVAFDVEPVDPKVTDSAELAVLIARHGRQYVDFQALVQANTDDDVWKTVFSDDVRVRAFVAKNWRALVRPLPRDSPVKLTKVLGISRCVSVADPETVRIDAGELPAALNDPEFDSKFGLENIALPLLVLPAVYFEHLHVDEQAAAKRRKRLQERADRGEDSGSDGESDDESEDADEETESQPPAKRGRAEASKPPAKRSK